MESNVQKVSEKEANLKALASNEKYKKMDADKRNSLIKQARTRIAWYKANHDERVTAIRELYFNNASQDEIVAKMIELLVEKPKASDNKDFEALLKL